MTERCMPANVPGPRAPFSVSTYPIAPAPPLSPIVPMRSSSIEHRAQLGAEEMDLTRFDGHLTGPKLRAEVFDEITEAPGRFAAA